MSNMAQHKIVKMDHWIPRYKYQLVELLSGRYPNDSWKFKGFSKKRLYAIWFNVLRKEDKGDGQNGDNTPFGSQLGRGLL